MDYFNTQLRCPTCDHTARGVAFATGTTAGTIYQCPRCERRELDGAAFLPGDSGECNHTWAPHERRMISNEEEYEREGAPGREQGVFVAAPYELAGSELVSKVCLDCGEIEPVEGNPHFPERGDE